MLTKSLNRKIIFLIKSINILIVLYFGIVLAKVFWWLISPSIPNVYVEKTTIKRDDSIVKNIINRAPFGIITIVKNENAPITIAQQIKLNGIYLSDNNNSFAIINFNNKSKPYKIGDVIADGAIIKNITVNSILVSQNGNEAFVNLSQGKIDGTSNNKQISIDQNENTNTEEIRNNLVRQNIEPNVQQPDINRPDLRFRRP